MNDGRLNYECPCCFTENEWPIESQDGAPGSAQPGDFTMCAGCGATLVVSDELGVRLPTAEERAHWPEPVVTELKRLHDQWWALVRSGYG
jgi:hypothetical protein